MIKFIKYHLLYLFNNLWLLLTLIMCLLSGFLFYYLGGGFESSLQRLLEYNQYLVEFEKEAFLISNIILSLWIISSSKEMFIVNDPNILLINKEKYVKSKILAYLIYYFFISILVYGMYQIVIFLLYGVVKYNYLFIINLLLNVLLVHLLVVLANGRSKNILLTIIYIIVYLILNTVLLVEFKYKNIIEFFLPFLNVDYPVYGYVHSILIVLLLYYTSSYKHITYYE